MHSEYPLWVRVIFWLIAKVIEICEAIYGWAK